MRQWNSSILALLFLLPVAAARADDGPAAGQPVTPASSTQVSTPTPKPQAPVSGAPRRGWLDYAFVGVNGIFQSSSWDFSDRLTFTEYVESGESRSSYQVESGPGWSAGGAVRAWRNLAVGVGVSRFTRSGSAEVSAGIPHPFFFDEPREIVGLLDNVRREETAVHVSVSWVANVGRHLVVAVGGGPSFFSVKQGFAGMPQWEQAYPFDTATFVGADTREISANAVGYNIGLDVGFYFTRALGVGLETRYSRAQVDMDAPGGTLDLDAGGLQVGGGVRVLFPGKAPARKSESPPWPPRPDPVPATPATRAQETATDSPSSIGVPSAVVAPAIDTAGNAAGEIVPARPVREEPPPWIPGHTPPALPYRARIELAIDAGGRVTAVRFLESNRPDYDHHVRLAVKNWRYVAATKNGIAVESIRTVYLEIPAR